MKIFARELQKQLERAAREFPAVILTGPRRAGKTFLLRRTFPRASYHLLEDPDVLARVKSDPRGWLEEIRPPAIIDEIQNAPELFPYVRSTIDGGGEKKGQWFLTGSQDFSLMAGVTESMTGRAAVFRLLPLSWREAGSWSLLRGAFPEVLQHRKQARTWFSSYVQTYLERDVRSLKAVKDLATFRRFLSLVASRNGQTLNRTDLAAPLGISVPTVSDWLGVLQTTGQLLLVQPFYENFGKRLTKSPKLYWMDPGLVCFLLGIETKAELERSPFLGSVFEGFLASEIVKNQVNAGRNQALYYFRDHQGLEVDFLAMGRDGRLNLIEAKWSKTIRPEDAAPLRSLAAAVKNRAVSPLVVHRAARSGKKLEALAPGVKALAVEEFLGRFPEEL